MSTKNTKQSKSKPPLSIQYLVSNMGIEEVFANSEVVPKIIESGPDKIKEILVGLWNEYRTSDYAKVFELVDIDREVTKEDFQVKYGMSLNEDPILFITFPDMIGETMHAEAKCFAAAFKDGEFPPRMFTMEYYNEYPEDVHKGRFILGEWKTKNGEIVEHINMDIMNGTTVTDFMNIIGKMYAEK